MRAGLLCLLLLVPLATAAQGEARRSPAPRAPCAAKANARHLTGKAWRNYRVACRTRRMERKHGKDVVRAMWDGLLGPLPR